MTQCVFTVHTLKIEVYVLDSGHFWLKKVMLQYHDVVSLLNTILQSPFSGWLDVICVEALCRFTHHIGGRNMVITS